MNPYLVLGLSFEANDEEIRERYKELVVRYPPDRFPDRFAGIREAFESLKSERERIRTHMFRFDKSGRLLNKNKSRQMNWDRRRLSADELAELIRGE